MVEHTTSSLLVQQAAVEKQSSWCKQVCVFFFFSWLHFCQITGVIWKPIWQKRGTCACACASLCVLPHACVWVFACACVHLWVLPHLQGRWFITGKPWGRGPCQLLLSWKRVLETADLLSVSSSDSWDIDLAFSLALFHSVHPYCHSLCVLLCLSIFSLLLTLFAFAEMISYFF